LNARSSRVASQLALYRTIALAFFGSACQECGSGERLAFHHVDKDGFNNDLSNIKLLCSPCHLKAHQKLPRRGHVIRFPLDLMKYVHQLTMNHPELSYMRPSDFCRDAVREKVERIRNQEKQTLEVAASTTAPP